MATPYRGREALDYVRASRGNPYGLDTESRDVHLMQRIAAADEAALEDLMAAYWQPLVAFASRVLQQPDAAEDIALETFAQLWECREEWQQEGSPRAYLFRIARNRALNERRRARVRTARAAKLHREQREEMGPTTADRFEQLALERVGDRQATGAPPPGLLFGPIPWHEVRGDSRHPGSGAQTVANHISTALSDLQRMLVPFLGDSR